MKGEVETQFLLSGLLLQTQPLHSPEQHTKAHMEFSSHFGFRPNPKNGRRLDFLRYSFNQ